MTSTLKLIISYETLNLPTPFNGTCFGHTMNKTIQYVMTDFGIVSKDLGIVNIKSTQASLQACIT